MLSRRDKLLSQPWEDRRFSDHRTKVTSALPVIDSRAPAPRPHVTLKLKKCQQEADRLNKIRNDNFSLLQRLNRIMKVNRLDNRWVKPLPNLQHKVGLFYDTKSLSDKHRWRPVLIPTTVKQTHSRCYACDIKKMLHELDMYSTPPESQPPSNSELTQIKSTL